MNIKQVLVFLTVASLLGSLIWLMTERSWEPLVTTIGLVCALIAELYNGRDDDNNQNVKMQQKGGKNSSNYQSARDINIKLK
jgi:hypothetical protein